VTIAAGQTITIYLRVDARNATAGSTVTATVTIPSTTPVVLPVATVQGKGISARLWEGPENVLTCIGVEDVPGTPFDNDFSLRIEENWNDALTSFSDEYSLENNDSNHLAGSSNPLVPTNGSNILITLQHIPSGVTVTARQPVPCDPTRECIGGNLTFGTLYSSPYVGDINGDAKMQVMFFYPTETTNMKVIEWATFGFKLSSAGPLPPGQGSGITATVTLTDNYPYSNPTPPPNGDAPWWSPAEASSPMPVVNFFDCRTEMLFPYVNTYGASAPTTSQSFSSFGTGIDFANTTWDPFGLPGPGGVGYRYPDLAKGTATPQNGNCTLYFYPADGSATQVFATPTINSGQSYAFDLTTAVPGFAGRTGYAIAICNFQNAHAFAEIYDNYANLGVKGPNTILGYEANVLPNPGLYPRTPAGKGFGEGAVTSSWEWNVGHPGSPGAVQ
jgi:hypothetical protein